MDLLIQTKIQTLYCPFPKKIWLDISNIVFSHPPRTQRSENTDKKHISAATGKGSICQVKYET